jgi:surface protein
MKGILIFLFFTVTTINAQQAFITTWKTDNPGPSDDLTIKIPLATESTYDFTVDWGDNTSDEYVGMGNAITAMHTYLAPGTYEVAISGTFPRIDFSNLPTDRQKILSVEQWGDIAWESFENAFQACINLHVYAIDAPNLSLVSSLRKMFLNCSSFNAAIEYWDVSSITDMSHLFALAGSFNQPLDMWDVSNVVDMSNMFHFATSFNQPLHSWSVINVTNMSGLFMDATNFNQPIDTWNVSNVNNMSSMFLFSNFNQPINSWDVSNVTDMSLMFGNASQFNQPLNNWDVSSVNTMSGIFSGAQSFNQPLNNWDVSNVVYMNGMFSGAWLFNQPLNTWDVSNATTMSSMLSSTLSFNQPLDLWNVQNVTSMVNMFLGSNQFNYSLETWDVSSVTTMQGMFGLANSFNQPLDNWDVSNVTTMQNMFNQNTAFDHSLGTWNMSNVSNATNMFNSSNLSPCNYDSTLVGWSQQNLQLNVPLGVQGLQHTQNGADAKQSIIDNYGWQIFGDELIVIPELVVTSEVNGTEISIFASEGLGDYTFLWTGPNGFESNNSSIVAPQNGTYTVIVSDGCNQWTETFEILTVGISHSEADSFQLFPNPTTGLIYGFSNSSEYSKIQVFDLNGKQVFESDFTGSVISFDLSHLNSGIYFGRLLNNQGTIFATQRICVAR